MHTETTWSDRKHKRCPPPTLRACRAMPGLPGLPASQSSRRHATLAFRALHRQRPRDGDPAGSTVHAGPGTPGGPGPTRGGPLQCLLAAARPCKHLASDDLSAQRETGHSSHSARRRGRAGGLRRAGRMVTRGGEEAERAAALQSPLACRLALHCREAASTAGACYFRPGVTR
jgi:hypothetical protein